VEKEESERGATEGKKETQGGEGRRDGAKEGRLGARVGERK
jgi:hypothetical protein